MKANFESEQPENDLYAESDQDWCAERYWASVVPLAEYENGRFRRPEVMITSDVAPADIGVVRPG